MIPDKNAALVGWTDDQWNLVLTTVTAEAQKARLAASFLPVTGPLDATNVAVSSLILRPSGTPPGVALGANPTTRLEVDSDPNLKIATISTLVYLRAHEIADPDLAAGLTMFRRAANMIARVEDAIVFDGQTPKLGTLGTSVDIKNISWLGLLPYVARPANAARFGANGTSVFAAVMDAITTLEADGYFGPFACVLGSALFQSASRPDVAFVSVRDRLLPFLDGLLFRSSVIDDDAGVVIALGSGLIEIVLASDVNVNFVQINTEPRWVFRLSERIALRVKDQRAVQALTFPDPATL
jgi:uncharacterized linocin/CFP29 family protein